MASDAWHSQFAPSHYLGRVDLARLLTRNDTASDAATHANTSMCVLCNQRPAAGLKLNDGSFLCDSCFQQISQTTYPERYEAAHRNHIVHMEARRLAWESFRAAYEYHGRYGLPILMLALALLAASVLHIGFLPLSFGFFLAGYIVRAKERERTGEWLRLRSEWEASHQPPPSPTLLHFHDPRAELTQRDHSILRVLNHWPGYPPFWSALREFVKARDSGRCQVTGCPSRLTLHIHHIIPTADGGPHTPSNLVSLCEFHHALEPDNGHQRIWGVVRSRYFTLVGAHERSNRTGKGTHQVRPHLRRLELASLQDLRSLHETFGFRCPTCKGTGLQFTLHTRTNLIRVCCPHCGNGTEGPQQLAEESGPRLAELLLVSRQSGRWKANWDMLAKRKESTWSTWTRIETRSRIAKRKRSGRRKAGGTRGFAILFL